MPDKKQKYYKPTLVLGLLFLGAYFLSGYLFEKLWIFSFIPIALFAPAFLIFFILTIRQKSKRGILIGIFLIGIFFIAELLDSDLFKSKKILEATLMDDLSAIHLTLREDKRFEVVSSTVFTEQIFKGKYQLLGDKIIFEDRPYDSDFIPDTLTIIGDKIVCQFDKNGKPVTGFATYFDIKRNKIQSPP